MTCQTKPQNLENPHESEVPTPMTETTIAKRELNTTDENLPVGVVIERLWPKTGVTADQLTEICERRNYNAATAELLVEICKDHGLKLPKVIELIDETAISPENAQMICNAWAASEDPAEKTSMPIAGLKYLAEISKHFPDLLHEPDDLFEALCDIRSATGEDNKVKALELFLKLVEGVHNGDFEACIEAIGELSGNLDGENIGEGLLAEGNEDDE